MNYTQTNDELMHYGVLGMKWGVRRGGQHATKAYEKASKKLNKLDQKVQKKNAKQKKAYSKYAKVAGRSGFFRGESDIRKAREKYKTADAKFVNSMVKANKWYGKMEKVFKDTDIKMSEKQRAMGERYVKAIEDRMSRTGFDIR